MQKLSDEQLNKFIFYWENGIRQGGTEEILACLLELKQLRAEKRQVCQNGHTTARKPLKGFQIK